MSNFIYVCMTEHQEHGGGGGESEGETNLCEVLTCHNLATEWIENEVNNPGIDGVAAKLQDGWEESGEYENPWWSIWVERWDLDHPRGVRVVTPGRLPVSRCDIEENPRLVHHCSQYGWQVRGYGTVIPE